MRREHVRPIFAHHETFQPRTGWFKKAFDAGLSSNGSVFLDDRATVLLGVGKNMVRAIRFWGLAAKILVSVRDPERPRTTLAIPSNFGRMVFGENGCDPFLEDAGTVWLLQWALLRPPCLLPVWWVAFNEFGALEFQEDDLTDATMRQVGLVPEWSSPHPPSVKKDADCLLRMYAPAGRGKSLEDALDCPFRVLRLIEPIRDVVKTYRFMLGHKANLPHEIIGFAAFDYMAHASTSRTLMISALATAPRSPGRVFKVSEEEITVALRQLAKDSRGFSVETPAGVPQLVLREQPTRLATVMLRSYYERTRAAGHSIDVPGGEVFSENATPALEFLEA